MAEKDVHNVDICRQLRMGGPEDPRSMLSSKGVWNVINLEKLNYKAKDDWTSSKCLLDGWKKESIGLEIHHFEGPNVNEAFVVLANSHQLDLLKQFGPNLICIDSTHGCSMYGHMVTTLMIRDTRNENYPVAYCISQKKDEATWRKFFLILKEEIGFLVPQYFLSDDDCSFYNAWCHVMGKPGNRRLCLWHVIKNWKQRYHNLPGVKDALQRITDATDKAE